MLLREFKRTGPLTIFLIIVILILLWVGAFYRIRRQFSWYFDIDSMPFYEFMSGLTGTHPVPGIAFSFLLVGLMAFLVVNLNTSLFFINERTFLPALFYILITALVPHYQVMNPAIFAAVFLMLAIRRIMDSYRVQGTAYCFFDAGILISIGSLFYANLVWFSSLIFIGMSLLRTWSIKEIVVSFLGLLTPFVLTPAIYYVFGEDPETIFSMFAYNLFGRHSLSTFGIVIIAGFFVTSILTLVAISHLLATINSKKIQSRKTFFLLLWVFFISIAVYMMMPSVSAEMIWITSIPVSYFLSHYFVFQKKKISEIIFSVFLFVILFVQIWYLTK
ncbi:MAG TPA: DUF6427 family protein [Bacteroidales bacterium]|nr:DUF6427 family protein [Bacteroidales bacterium]